jgi:signal transduction histidine kinase
MSRRSFFPRIAPLAATVFTAGACWQIVNLFLFRLEYPNYLPYIGFSIAMIILLAVQLITGVLMLLTPVRFYSRIFLAVRSLSFLIYAHSLGPNILFVLPSLLPLIWEICLYEDFPTNLRLTVLLIGISLLIKIPLILNNPGLKLIHILLVYIATALASAGFGAYLVRNRQKLIKYAREVKKLDQAFADLSEVSEDYLHFANTAEERSMKSERERITRELHDTIGYTFTNLIMLMEAAKRLIGKDPSGLKTKLDDAGAQAQEGLAETRRSLYLLREKSVVKAQGLAAIARLIKTFESSTGVKVKIDYANTPYSCGSEIDSIIYHFVQEGLTNSFRHGKATEIAITFWQEDDIIKVTILDNGLGASLIQEGIGIGGMRERLGKIGGTLDFHNSFGGFELQAEIPLSR